MIYCFDLDNTLLKTEGTDYKNSKPIQEAIDKVNELYNQGNTIKIFTARGSRSGIDWREFTKIQLHYYGIRYHEVILGKPHADRFIDDKAINVKDWMNE